MRSLLGLLCVGGTTAVEAWKVKKTTPAGVKTILTPPQIVLLGPSPMSLFANPNGKAFFEDPGAACNDYQEGDISQNVSAGR
jgi:hypothetical protein